ncbi:hypothetical protein BZA05DRAFT_107473 [Tricharina praecox]|uniref:uncharacterized protein n=1 Tax=Tricharina praecox TaxID=43433 RepID=UPI00221FDFB1|nr:uncharacterized protein BZA05DRAFT_107473 [Tricharina praecox]KAI5857832.1 hypothetical protein BZA05DRAFT_107473 [Tricharina praecox]
MFSSSIPPEVFHTLPTLAGTEISPSGYPIPTVTFICASCERIIGDSSTLLFLHHKQLTLTFTRLTSVSASLPIQFSPPGEWDENCTFHPLSCDKCHTILGKKHLATTSELGQFQNQYTVDTEKVGIYYHGALEPAAQPVELAGVLRVLHPDPDEVVEQMQSIMSVCVGLSENVGELARMLKRVAAVAGLGVGETVARLAGEAEAELPVVEKDALGETIRALLSRVDGIEETVETLKQDATIFERAGKSSSAKRKRHVLPETAHYVSESPRSAEDSMQRTVIPNSQSTDENPPFQHPTELEHESDFQEIEHLPTPPESRRTYLDESQPKKSHKKKKPKEDNGYEMPDLEEDIKPVKRKVRSGEFDGSTKRPATRGTRKK